eukprot:jgi/Botrbrau1/23160/Bobra.0041s0011.1
MAPTMERQADTKPSQTKIRVKSFISKKKKREKLRRTSKMPDHFLCPISREPMRRPVLPSSGQAYDEINIVRHCSGKDKQRDPVSGQALKIKRGKGLQRTPEHLLRNIISQQASKAGVYIPPVEKELLLKHLRKEFKKDAAKAFVDDTFLGYICKMELAMHIHELCLEANKQDAAEGVYCALVEACLSCQQSPEIVKLGADELRTSNVAWRNIACLHEALAAAQNPDSRGELLNIIEKRFRDRDYLPKQAMKVLKFYTDSVPVQQAKFRISETVLLQGGQDLPCAPLDYEDPVNLALRVLEELYGCLPDTEASIPSFWKLGIAALRKMEPGGSLDAENMHRLFAMDRRDVLQTLARDSAPTLEWHMRRQRDGYMLLIEYIARYDMYDIGPFEDSDEDELESGDDMYDELEASGGRLIFPMPPFRLDLL